MYLFIWVVGEYLDKTRPSIMVTVASPLFLLLQDTGRTVRLL